MPDRALPKFLAPSLFLMGIAFLSGCSVYMPIFLSQQQLQDYQLKENAEAFGCFGQVAFTWGSHPKCLLPLGRETAAPSQFPIGTRVRIITVKKHSIWFFADEPQPSVALLRVGEGSKAVKVFADWPKVLRILEEIPAR